MKYFICLLSVLSIAFQVAWADAWTGVTSEPASTTEVDGKSFYVITNAEELAWFAEQVNGGSSSISAVLGNDIVFAADEESISTVAWTPIGVDENHQFSGILDGAGFTIYGLYVGKRQYAGLIGVLAETGVVRNLKLASGSNEGTKYAGGVVALSYGTIRNTTNFSSVSATGTLVYAGGIVGYNEGNILDCDNEGKVSTTYESGKAGKYYGYSGGMTGYSTGFVTGCLNKAAVSAYIRIYNSYSAYAYVYAGGIAAYSTGSVVKSMNSGSTSAKFGASYSYSPDAYAGGIVGYNTGILSTCVNSGVVESNGSTYSTQGYDHEYAGGIAGSSVSVVSDCINKGKTSSSGYYHYAAGVLPKGKAANSFDVVSLKYWIKESEIQGTESLMKSAQFAWLLNTSNGSTDNSGIWSWNNEFPYLADESNRPIYRVTFNDGIVDFYAYSSYMGTTPKPDDAEPEAGEKFVAWIDKDGKVFRSRDIVSEDRAFYAVFIDEEASAYIITIKDGDNTYSILTDEEGKLTSLPEHGLVPEGMEFDGWYTSDKKKVDESTIFNSSTTITAVYTRLKYTITFLDFDDRVVLENRFELGSIPVAESPERSSTSFYSYTFKEWTPQIVAVDGPATYVAVYDSTKIIWLSVNIDGKESSVVDGEEILLPSASERDGYVFVGWYDAEGNKLGDEGDKIVVNTDLVIEAKYEKINDSSSSSKTEPTSSSSMPMESSSSQTEKVITVVNNPKFNVNVEGHVLHVSGIHENSLVAVMDLQGRVVRTAYADGANFDVVLPVSGSYMIRISNYTRLVHVR